MLIIYLDLLIFLLLLVIMLCFLIILPMSPIIKFGPNRNFFQMYVFYPVWLFCFCIICINIFEPMLYFLAKSLYLDIQVGLFEIFGDYSSLIVLNNIIVILEYIFEPLWVQVLITHEYIYIYILSIFLILI